ncbi:MAG: hypothetical protein ACREJD_16430 [Phycisphaerales bacterium]
MNRPNDSKKAACIRCILASTGTAFFAHAAFAAQTFEWTSSLGGSWFSAANWNPAEVPASDTDTANIGGSQAFAVDISGANAMIGFARLTNAAATLNVRQGWFLSIAQGMTINGHLIVGDGQPSGIATLKLGVNFGVDALGTGRVTLKAPSADPTKAQLFVGAGKVSTWGKDLLIEGTGALIGAQRVLGTVLANDPGGAALEFRGGSIDGSGLGKYYADGSVLRLFQSQVTDAYLEARNGGRIELSAPSSSGIATTELLKRATVRGDLRCILNTTKILDTDFAGDLEILPGAGAYFGGYTKPTYMNVLVRSGAGAGDARLTFATGTPPGGGAITLNAATNLYEARLIVDQATLGGTWALNGQGMVEGSFALDGTIVADRPAGLPLLIWHGTVTGPGTIEARGGVAAFGEDSVVNNVHLLSTQGGRIAVVNDSIISERSTWTNVVADSPVEVTNLSELLLSGSRINGDLLVGSGFVKLQGVASTINGDIDLSFLLPNRGSSLGTDPGVLLLGSGKIVLRSVSNDNWSQFYGNSLTLPETREVHGSGMLSGTLQILGPIFADDPTGLGLWFAGDVRGSGSNTIEVTTGELILSRPGTSVGDLVSVSQFKVHAAPGAKPVRIGYGSLYPYGDPRVLITSMDFDAETVVSQYRVQLTDSIFRRACEVRSGVFCEVFGTTRFDSDLILTPDDSGAGPLVSFRAVPPAPLPRVLFANNHTGVSTGTILPDFTGIFRGRLEGTGTLANPKTVGGTIAPSDVSTGGPAGILFIANTALNLAPDFTFEADVISTTVYDRIDAPLGAFANGKLKISAAPGFYPPPSFNFHLIRGATTGAFTSVIGPAGFVTTMTYNKAGALARFEKICAADFNGDGRVDDADFAIFCAGYDTMLCNDPSMPESCPADLNRDGVVDDSDFQMFVVAYDQLGCL